MSVWLLIGVGLIALGYLIPRRMEDKAVAPIVGAIRRLRAAAVKPARRGPAPPDHPRLQAEAEYYQSTARDLAARGFIALGDLVEYREDGSEVGVSRWFAAADGSIGGWFAMTSRSTPVVMFISELAPAGFVATFFGGPTTYLAIPPTVRRTIVEHSRGLDAAIGAHREAVAAAGGTIARAIRSRDDAVTTVDALRAHVNAWRAAQGPADLVDLDLQSIVPGHHREFAKAVQRAMRG